MKTILNPYISFKDNTREAMVFYQTVFGGTLKMDTFKDFHISQDPSEDNKIMHAMLEADNGLTFMGADTPAGMQYEPGARVSMTISGDNLAEIKGYFDKLSVGGTVTQPLEKAPWGDTFGMLVDRFGVDWMMNIAGPKA